MKSITIEAVIRRATEPIVRSDPPAYFPDHVVVATPREIDAEIATFIGGTCSHTSQIDTVALVLPASGRVDVTKILDAAAPRLSKDSSIFVQGGFVSSGMLDRLTKDYSRVTLNGCTLGSGWWKVGPVDRKCQWFDLDQCHAAPLPISLKRGCASWLTLENLRIVGMQPEGTQHLGTTYRPMEPKHHPKYTCRVEDLVRAFYHAGLDSLILCDCGDVGFLAHFPESKISDLTLSGCALTDGLLDWIKNCHNLDSLSVTWRKGALLDWTKLRRLKRLRYLDVTESPCTDEDLVQILAATKLRSIHTYYTSLTHQSWKPLLSHPSLRSIWVGMGMMGDNMPDLPPESKVKEIVALNVSDNFMGYAGNIAARYPGMKIYQM